MNNLLIYSVILSLFWEFFSVLLKPVLAVFLREKSSYRNLKREISDLNSELSKISMIDEFAKYARLQRKVNVLKTQLDGNVSEQLQDTIKVKFLVTSAAQILLGLITVIFLWMYKYEPVSVFPEVWISPISSFISFPTSINGAVGLPFWFSVSKVFAKSIATVTPSFTKK